jgi:biotin synthase-related radical SAM superfamily protein
MTRPQDLEQQDHLPIVPFVPVACPTCHRPKPFTYGRKARVRYHRCQHCGAEYRSLELTRKQMREFDAPGPSQ